MKLDKDFMSHCYTLASVGTKLKTKRYMSRQCAKEDMYKYCDKHNLSIISVWDDKHFKTYNCGNGIKFFINRVY